MCTHYKSNRDSFPGIYMKQLADTSYATKCDFSQSMMLSDVNASRCIWCMFCTTICVMTEAYFTSCAEHNSCSKIFCSTWPPYWCFKWRVGVISSKQTWYKNTWVSITDFIFTEHIRAYMSRGFGSLMICDHKIVNNCSLKMGVMIFHICYHVYFAHMESNMVFTI